MGTSSSREFDVQMKEMKEMKETIRAMKWRLSKVEADNAIMNKTITNLKVSNNELARNVAKLHERVFNMPVDQDRSVRVPKMARSIYAL